MPEEENEDIDQWPHTQLEGLTVGSLSSALMCPTHMLSVVCPQENWMAPVQGRDERGSGSWCGLRQLSSVLFKEFTQWVMCPHHQVQGSR